MKKALVAFLGTSNYRPVVYALGSRIARKTPLTFVALHQFYPDYSPLILATREAMKKNRALVERELGDEPSWVEIPSGRTQEEIWRILGRLVSIFKTYDELILDVTHGFRAQPLIVFSALLLVRTLKKTRVHRVFYGPYDQKDRQGEGSFFDLTPLLDFVDWIHALGALERYGKADQVAKLLADENSAAWRSGAEIKPRHLQNLSSVLERINLALAVNRPHEVAEQALRLRGLLPKAKNDFSMVAALSPIGDLLTLSVQSYIGLIKGTRENPFTARRRFMLRSLARMIEFQLNNYAYAQAITLAREALVTKLCLDMGLDPYERGSRQAAEALLGAWKHIQSVEGRLTKNQQEYAALWDRISQVRNDVSHAAFRKSGGNADAVARQIKAVSERVVEWLGR